MRREIIHLELRGKTNATGVTYAPGPVGRFFAVIIIGIVALAIMTLVLVVGLSMMLLVWLMLFMAVVWMVVRSVLFSTFRTRIAHKLNRDRRSIDVG